uniref:Methyltransf_21 domain-containing protein n=1 Tax=Haemonchus contortus TaxID=6289 RepID=A0A7I4Z542_HAECO
MVVSGHCTLLLILVVCMFLFMINFNSTLVPSTSRDPPFKSNKTVRTRRFYVTSNTAPAVTAAFEDWRQCVIKQLGKKKSDPKLWIKFGAIVVECTASTELSRIVITPIRNKDEIKRYIYSSDTTHPAVVITLGVGEDIIAEKLLKKTLPLGSKFFGADPVWEKNADLFAQVGKFFPIAVGKETGYIAADILTKGRYQSSNVMTIDLVTFLTKMVNESMIDLILMDNEGAEYDIVQLLTVDKVFDKHGIVVCQVNAEFHPPRNGQSYIDYLKIMLDTIKAGRFAPIFVLNEKNTWQRAFFVNYSSHRCRRKYLDHFFRKTSNTSRYYS